MRVTLAGVIFMRNYLDGRCLDGGDEPAIPSIRYELTYGSYLYEELPKMKVILARVIFVRNYSGRSHPDGGNMPTIPSTI